MIYIFIIYGSKYIVNINTYINYCELPLTIIVVVIETGSYYVDLAILELYVGHADLNNYIFVEKNVS